MTHRLEARSLAKSFKRNYVVKDVALSMRSGEMVGLLGPNGAGKTTSFYMIVGLIPVTSGQVLLNEQDITLLPMHQRARLGIGYLPQEPSVFRRMTVADNIRAILELRQDLNEIEQASRLETLLHELGIEKIRDTLGISLSGGERRRVEIARALAMEPKFMLLDEPFAGVDPISVIDIKNIIKQLAARNIGVLITDHNVRETLTLCHRAYIVNEGEIICEGTPSEILDNQRAREVYFGEEFHL